MVSMSVNQSPATCHKRGTIVTLFALIATLQLASSFVAPQSTSVNKGLAPYRRRQVTIQSPVANPQPRLSDDFQATLASSVEEGGGSDSDAAAAEKKRVEDLKKQIRQEGGLFTVRTKVGAMNFFSLYYLVMEVLTAFPWWLGLTFYQFFRLITGNRFDRNRKIPIMISQSWAHALFRLTRSYPRCENQEILDKFFAENRAAMVVANHNSWMDIPYLGLTIGWRNYKWITKLELEKVPVLGKAIKVGGSLMVDRKDKRSGLKALKGGIQYLKDGINLCTFPEGTRSKDGRLMEFKNGAFKMAHKAGAPVIPVCIIGTNIAHPPHWLFPCRAARNIAKVVIHEPIESVGKTEEELAAAVRKTMIEGLPESQRPKDGK